MAAQLGEMAVGSIVKLNVDGVPTNFIVVHQGNPDPELYDESCNGTWLLMHTVYSSERVVWDDSNNDYAASNVNSWLNDSNSGFLSMLDDTILRAIKQVKIPFRSGPGNSSAVNSGIYGLLCKAFLLSAYELGAAEDVSVACPVDGEKLDYFLSGNSDEAEAKRIVWDESGGISGWYTRSPWLTGSGADISAKCSSIIGVYPDGQIWCISLAGYNPRPALILPFDCLVDDNNFIITNQSPAAPSGLTVPDTVPGGGELLVSWAASTDPDGNLTGYELERKTDAADWAQVYKGEQLSFTDQITKGWQTVRYRVRAVDSYSAASSWTESELRTVDNNTAPVIECEHPGGSDLGEKAEPFAVNYTVTDPDGDPLTLTETVDGQTTRTETEAASGAAFEAAVLGDPAEFQKILNGPHTLTITASDGKAQTTHTLTFTKKVTSASVTLSQPLAVEGDITLAALRVTGSIPEDALFTVEVTNNGADDQPVWQDATAEVKRGANIVFANHTAAKGAAFNFRVNVSRGPSGQGGYITAITGAFQ